MNIRPWKLTGNYLLVFVIVLFFALPVIAGTRKQLGNSSLRMNPRFANSSSTLELPSRNNELDELAPQNYTILAIRVDFQEDTLSTTTGDGGFFYEIPEDYLGDDEEWIVDPPPHDKQYFEDQLFAAKNYFNKFSNGLVDFTGVLDNGPDSGGDIFPLDDQAAYTLPYPIWHVNYGNPDRESRLDTTLTNLFVDAFRLAAQDEDFMDAARLANSYDTPVIYLIFHAGAGNEFDTGYDETPHDIPSVFIGADDIWKYATDDGTGFVDSDNKRLILEDGLYVTQGAILPETQRQGSTEVGMYGTMCHHIGFMIGLKHLYQPVTGDPGIGLFGLMDRGFGSFFGIIPTPPCAWNRYQVGWDSATVIRNGDVSIASLNLPNSVLSDSLYRLVKIPVSDDEYFLLESRHRDPEDDSLTYAYDRDGRRMTLHNDFEIEVEDGFRVPVRIEDHDFDTPASGILIWHIDQSVIDEKARFDRIQENPDRRGVALEEADGSVDIGEDYAFLTAGDGSEYGVQDDAYYNGNDVWRDANNSYYEEYGPDTYPNSNSNNGGATQVLIKNFSSIKDTMRCKIATAWEQGAFPDTLDAKGLNVTFANIDGDEAGINEVVFFDEDGKIWIYDGEGNSYSSTGVQVLQIPEISNIAVFDLDGNGQDELFATSGNSLFHIVYDLEINRPVNRLLQFRENGHDINLDDILIARQQDSPVFVLTGKNEESDFVILIDEDFTTDRQLRDFDSESMTLVGTANSDTVAFLHQDGNITLLTIGSGEITQLEYPNVNQSQVPLIWHYDHIMSADFDGDGNGDIAAWSSVETWPIIWYNSDNWANYDILIDFNSNLLFSLDADFDGLPEVGTINASASNLAYFEQTGLLSEASSGHIHGISGGLPYNPLVVDLTGREDYGLFYSLYASGANNGCLYVKGIDLENQREISGFPLSLQKIDPVLIDPGFSIPTGTVIPDGQIAISQIDDDPNLEMFVWNKENGIINVYNLLTDQGNTPKIIWGQEGGNPSRTRQGQAANYQLFSQSNASATLDDAYAWPNPVKNENYVQIRYRSQSGTTANLDIYDLVGRKIGSWSDSIDPGIDNEFRINIASWESGVYIARLEAGDKHKIIRFAVIK